MSGIYVKDMKMPKFCLLCPFEHMMMCSLRERFTDIHERVRPDWCPLTYIPDNALIVKPKEEAET